MNGKRTAISKRFANGITARGDPKRGRHFFVFWVSRCEVFEVDEVSTNAVDKLVITRLLAPTESGEPAVCLSKLQ
jgi:hypothetical protein